MKTILIVGLIAFLIVYLYDYYEPNFDTIVLKNKRYKVIWYNTYINYQAEPKRDYKILYEINND